MKTLDEVIDDFEKACDLERRCEGCSGCLGQEYGCPNDGAECVPDALHYLKILKDILDPLKIKKITHEITCPQCNSVIAILLPESNPPLTWQELKGMEGKPVWVDGSAFAEGFWTIITGFGKASDTEYVFLLGDQYWKENMKDADDGVSWQAYRKER